MAFKLTVIHKVCFNSSLTNIKMCFSSNFTGNMNLLTFFSNFKIIDYRCFHFYYIKGRRHQKVINDIRILSAVAKIHSSRLNEINKQDSLIKSNCLKKIQETFKCAFEEAYVLMKQNKKLLFSQNEQSLIKVQRCQTYGLNLNTIKENISVLQYSEKDLKSRVEQLQKWNFKDINSGVKLVNLHFDELLLVTAIAVSDFNFLNGKNRIQYFADETKSQECEVCQLFLKHKFLLKMNVQRFQTILHILLDAGIMPENLLTDVYAFRYSPRWVSQKINKVKSSNGFGKNETVLKLWMLRCLPPVLERTLKLQEMNKEATLPYSSWTEFLCKELDISVVQVDIMIRYHPPLANVNPCKLKQIIEFLKEEGFCMQLVYNSPRVLCHKLETLKERLDLLRSLGYKVTNLHILCKNRKHFDKFIDRLKELKKFENEDVTF